MSRSEQRRPSAGTATRTARGVDGAHRLPAGGFTLVELLVVIGILGILIGLAIPATTAVLRRQRISSTEATMRTIATAINRFAREQPLQIEADLQYQMLGGVPPLREAKPAEDILGLFYTDIFSNLPPSPLNAFAADNESLSSYSYNTRPGQGSAYPATGEDFDLNETSALETTAKFRRLVERYLDMTAPVPENTDWYVANPSIKCLLLFLTTMSPQARTIINKMPDSLRSNEDQSFVYRDSNENWAYDPGPGGVGGERLVPLIAIVDAWGTPLRYAVKEPEAPDANTGNPAFPAVWELRSAGPDKQFAPRRTPEDPEDVVPIPFFDDVEDQYDDVVLTGP